MECQKPKRLRPRGRSGLKWLTVHTYQKSDESPSSRAEWVEISVYKYNCTRIFCLRPRGRSGLKFYFYSDFPYALPRLRPRGRSGLKLTANLSDKRRTPSPSSRAEWVEIDVFRRPGLFRHGLRPRGRSGLKSPSVLLSSSYPPSPSSRAEWVEIIVGCTYKMLPGVSVLAGGVG